MSSQRISVIDLFCGAGGFSTGFLMAGGYTIKAGVDKVGSMEQSFTKNHPGSKFFQHEISTDIPPEILAIQPDIVIGSPPCQGFSDARGVRYRLDKKNDLVFKYFDWVNTIQPKIAIMENVKGMTTIGKAWKSLDDPEQEDIDFMAYLEKTASKIGYTFKYKILNSKHFGVPQERERVFCLMTQKDLKLNVSLPQPTHGILGEKNNQPKLDDFLTAKDQLKKEETPLLPYVSIREALAGIPTPIKYEPKNGFDTINAQNYVYTQNKTWFQELIFDSDTLTNNISRVPKNEIECEIIKRVPEGKTYRSDRLGGKHIGVWQVFKDQLSTEEATLLKDLCMLRTKNNVKTKKGKHSEGYVPFRFLEEKGYSRETIENLIQTRFLKMPTSCYLTEKAKVAFSDTNKEEFEFPKDSSEEMVSKRDYSILERFTKLIEESEEEKEGEKKDKKDKPGDKRQNGEEELFVRDYQLGIQSNTLKKLVRLGWIKIGKVEEEYDITSKAGHRGKFSRLAMDEQSRTLMTSFTNLSEILHPTEHRGLSLREGARLMSFPDSFVFYGSFSLISLQIGNAVAPLVPRAIARRLLNAFQ